MSCKPERTHYLGETQGFTAEKGLIRGKYFRLLYLFLLFFSLCQRFLKLSHINRTSVILRIYHSVVTIFRSAIGLTWKNCL